MGLSAAGITSGLAAVGLGLGMVPGIGIVIVIGTGIFIGMKYLLGDSKKEKERKLSAENERKAQLVIKNLQNAINELLKRISSLEPKAEESEAKSKGNTSASRAVEFFEAHSRTEETATGNYIIQR